MTIGTNRRGTVLHRLLMIGSIVAAAAPLAAQQPAPAAPAEAVPSSAPSRPSPAPAPASASASSAASPASAAEDPVRPQVQTMEMVLRTAVDTGTQSFAKEATQIAKVIITPGDPPVVAGVATREGNETEYIFSVLVPQPWMTSLQILNLSRGGHIAGPNQVSTGGVGADVADADPMTASPELSSFDPERQYSIHVRDALVNAILDNAGVLPLSAGDRLIVMANGGDDSAVNPLYRPATNKLVLRVKGADLAQFRAGQISREEARRRIIETHF